MSLARVLGRLSRSLAVHAEGLRGGPTCGTVRRHWGEKAMNISRFSQGIIPHISSWCLAIVLFLLCVDPTPVSALSIGFSRIGRCIATPAGDPCNVTIVDNDLTRDSDPTVGVIGFSLVVGQLPDGLFAASGTVIETIVRAPGSGAVRGIQLRLTDAVVQNIAGGLGGTGGPGIVEGTIGIFSSVPFVSLTGVSGFASLVGQYENFRGANIGFADVGLQTRVGALIASVNPGIVTNTPSPVLFSEFDTGVFPFPVSNLLSAVINFELDAGDGFRLPASADSAVSPVPEPATLLLFGTTAAGLGLARWRGRHRP